MSNSNPIPIDAKAHGHLREAKEGIAESLATLRLAEPEFAHIGVGEAQVEFKHALALLARADAGVELLLMKVTERRTNGFPERKMR